MKDVIGQLAGIPLFTGLSKAQYEALARIGVRRSFRKGERIFSEGDEGTGFYVVVTGRVKIFKVSAEGKEQILHLFGPGESFGEVSVFTGQGFPADAVAAAQTTLLFFPRTAFIALIRKDPALALNMLAQLSRRLRQFAGLIEDLSLKEVPERLAKYLLYLSGRDGDGRGGGAGRFQGAACVAPGDDPGDPLPDPREDEPAGADPLPGGADLRSWTARASKRSPWRGRSYRRK